MRYLVTGLCLTVVVGFSSAGDEPLTKDGKLAHALKITQLQGGFAGFTGVEYTIEPDGTWATASVFRQKLTPKDKGKLSDKELRAIIGLLAKNEFQKLPAKSGKQPGANPHTITIEYGKFKATLVGQMPPKVDTDNVQSIESRFAAILRGVSGTLKSPDKKVG
ncbi:MAG: hypothetical protein FJ303_18025 [Planctomycetes bacterium]|nr:hypothetical protein [Planctomycetota bacterium]